MENLAVDGFYSNSLKMMLSFSHHNELLDIIESFDPKVGARDTVLKYEQKYFELYGTYPTKYLGVDVEAIERRILRDGVIR